MSDIVKPNNFDYHRSMNVYPNITYVASLIGEKTRSMILHTLMDGRALPASELASITGVSLQTISSHLSKLVEGQLLAVERHGKHRYYRLASPAVAHTLEALSLIAPPVKVVSLRQSDNLRAIRLARTCYDHLAGKLGVELTQIFLKKGIIQPVGKEFDITEPGEFWLAEKLGIDVSQLKKSRRILCGQCLDWSERRHHMSGALGAALTSRLLELKWIKKMPSTRAVQVTEAGMEQLKLLLGLEI